MYGSLTTKELKKKKHSSRQVGGAETGSWSERTCGKVAARGHSSLTFACGQTGRNNGGARWTTHPGVPVKENRASKPLTEKKLWGLRPQEKLPASQESSLEGPTGSQNIYKPTTQESAPEEPNLLMGSRGGDWKLAGR